MEKRKARKICMGIILCLAASGVTGCGAGKDENVESAGINGRVTSISDKQIVIEVFEGKEGAEKPQGTPPSDEQKPQGTPPSDEQKPQGTPPTEDGKSQTDQRKDGKEREHKESGKKKTYQIDSSTSIYKMSGEEKTEITVNDVELGSGVSVVADGNKAIRIIVQDTKKFDNTREKSENS